MPIVLVSELADVADFCEFLRAVQVRVVEVQGTLITATIPEALSDTHEQRELDGYLTIWNVLNPRCRVKLLEPPAGTGI